MCEIYERSIRKLTRVLHRFLSAYTVSMLCACIWGMSFNKKLCIFHKDKTMLKSDLGHAKGHFIFHKLRN